MSEKYAFIAAEHASPVPAPVRLTVARMCALLAVSKSGFYDWLSRPVSAAQRRREVLKVKISTLFDASHATYGYRRIHAELVRGGEQVGPELVRRLMREMDLIPVQPRPFRKTTNPDPDAPESEDLVQRDFTAERPGTKVVGDITYVRTWQGWLYLASLIDCATREVIGYAMADHMRTELPVEALQMAVRNGRVERDCIMHSDRGTQYTSCEYRTTLQDMGLRHSVGRTGQCWDNALAESFFASLKNERVHHMVYPTRKKAKEDIARYIELFYNHQRIHSALGYRTPHEARTDYLNSQLAA